MSFLDVLSLVGSGILVVLLLVATYYASRWYARRIGKIAAGRYVKIVDRTSLGQNASLLIVEVQGTYYLVGASDKNIQLITRLEDFTPDPPPAPTSALGISFRDLLSKAGFGGDGGRNSQDDGDT